MADKRMATFGVKQATKGGAVYRRLLVCMLQPGRLIGQHVTRRPFADRLHLV
jgi:hypothetical protein